MSRWWFGAGGPTVAASAAALVDVEARAENSAREQLVGWQARAAAAQREARTFRRAYGRASATIGQLRAECARLRLAQPGGPDVVHAVVHRADCPGGVCRCPKCCDAYPWCAGGDTRASAQRDEDVVAKAARYGDELNQHDENTANYLAIVAAFLSVHQRYDAGSCTCGWSPLGESHSQHVAQELAAAGLLAGTTTKAAL